MGQNDKPKPLSDEELARLLVDLECLKGRSLQRLIATIDRERAARIDAELEHGHAAQDYLKMEDERDAALAKLAEAIEALEWYAADDWEPNIGDVARKALARLRGQQ